MSRSVDTLRRLVIMLVLAACASSAAGAEPAASRNERREYALPAGDAASMLRKFAVQSGEQLLYVAPKVRGVKTNPVRGRYTAREALELMLANTALAVVEDSTSGALMVNRTAETKPPPSSPSTPPSQSNPATPKAMKPNSLLALLASWLAFAVGAPGNTPAAVSTGVLAGRVINARTGEYLERARLTIEGTALETFSDESGHYRLAGVPAGPATVRVFFTGLEPVTVPVSIKAGDTLQRDIELRPGGTRDDVVRLSEFVVGASREMDGTAIAINEQRFAADVRNVLSTEEFGFIAEGNLAEFLKFVPGVTVAYIGGNAREISIEGVPADNVPVSIDGFSIGTAKTSNDTSRSVELDMVSTNSASRIEVTYSPTPESQGSALAGSVNMVTRSAFERVRPIFNGSAYIMMRDNARDFHKTPDVFERTRKVHPGFDFSYVAPVNKRFGFTLSGGHSTQYTAGDQMQNTWRGAGSATNGTAFPHTTPDRPYLSQYRVRDEPKTVERTSVSATFDYRLTQNSRLSLSLLYSAYDTNLRYNFLTYDVNRVLPDFTPTSTHGVVGAGSVEITSQVRTRANRTFMPSLVWRYAGPIWKAEAGAGVAKQKDRQPDAEEGTFLAVTIRRTGLTVSFDDIFYLRPGVITVTDGTTGATVDPHQVGSYAVVNGTSNNNHGSDLKTTAFANARRDFSGPVPFSLKTGLDFRRSVRDVNVEARTFTFVGADRRASTVPSASDDSAAPFVDPVFAQRVAPFGFGHIERVDNRKLFALYQANPAYFTTNANTEYRSAVQASKRAEETISAAYVRGDLQFFHRRLKLVGGVRAEQTNIDADGPLNDPTRNFQRDAKGDFILGANGRPLTIATDALAVSQLTLLRRAAHAEKEYLRLFPSLNASFNLRDNLIARASYYHSVGRPSFNQYAGGVTLPDTESAPSNSNRITVNNVGIKAWSARTVRARLEYYFPGVGQVAIGAFRREFENFFGSTTFEATPEFLALYGLDPGLYGPYAVATQYNLPGTVRMQGFDLNYKQALTFLPPWARGLQVFANLSAQRATGEQAENFAGYVPRSGSWGLSLARPKYNLRVNWSYAGRRRAGDISPGASIEPGTFNWNSKKMTIDLLGEYYFWRRFGVFASMRNFGDAPDDTEIAGPSTPPHAQFRSRLQFGSLWTFGVKGTF